MQAWRREFTVYNIIQIIKDASQLFTCFVIISGVGTEDYLVVTTKNPPALQCIPWQAEPRGTKTNILGRLDFMESRGGILPSLIMVLHNNVRIF